MENIEYKRVGEILSQHLQGKADPVYVTNSVPKNPIIDAFSQLFIEYDVKVEQEADLIIYYILSQLKLYLHGNDNITLDHLYDLFDVDNKMMYNLLLAVELSLTEKKILLIS